MKKLLKAVFISPLMWIFKALLYLVLTIFVPFGYRWLWGVSAKTKLKKAHSKWRVAVLRHSATEVRRSKALLKKLDNPMTVSLKMLDTAKGYPKEVEDFFHKYTYLLYKSDKYSDSLDEHLQRCCRNYYWVCIVIPKSVYRSLKRDLPSEFIENQTDEAVYHEDKVSLIFNKIGISY